jgi:hypothetical protein
MTDSFLLVNKRRNNANSVTSYNKRKMSSGYSETTAI